jgi:hypothetical protein
VGKKGLDKGAVHVRVALVRRQIANHWRIVSRHDGRVANCFRGKGKCHQAEVELEIHVVSANRVAGTDPRGKHDNARARDDTNSSA